MSPNTRRLLAQLREEDVLQEMADALIRRYFDEWLISSPVEERERIFLKTQMVDELLTELFTILDTNRETDDG